VKDLASEFGEKAGKIWTTLNKKGPLSKRRILEITKLKENEFYTAVGWLARENKIFRKSENFYKLDNTNLTPVVGANAGKVWNVLNVWGEVDVPTIKKLAEIDEKEIYSAVGWLARENKIYADEKLAKYSLKR